MFVVRMSTSTVIPARRNGGERSSLTVVTTCLAVLDGSLDLLATGESNATCPTSVLPGKSSPVIFACCPGWTPMMSCSSTCALTT